MKCKNSFLLLFLLPENKFKKMSCIYIKDLHLLKISFHNYILYSSCKPISSSLRGNAVECTRHYTRNFFRDDLYTVLCTRREDNIFQFLWQSVEAYHHCRSLYSDLCPDEATITEELENCGNSRRPNAVAFDFHCFVRLCLR